MSPVNKSHRLKISKGCQFIDSFFFFRQVCRKSDDSQFQLKSLQFGGTMPKMFDQIIEVKSLYNAWKKVKANRGAAGIDRVSWFGFEENLDANLAELSRNLRTLTYQPLPAKFVQIAKASGKTRELGILTIRDRVAQRAVLNVIEPIFEAEMQSCSYAFRPQRNIEMAIQRVIIQRANGDLWTVESDIQNYFAEIDIRILLDDLSEKIKDSKVLRLIELWLEAGTLRDTDAEAEKTWWQITQNNLADIKDVFGETVNDSIDEFVASKLGFSTYENDYLQMNPDVKDLLELTADEDVAAKIKAEMTDAKTGMKRAVLKKILESGLLYAVSNRAMLAKFLGMKAFGLGGAILAGGIFAPKIYERAKNHLRIRKGVLQGSPISPLLANIYLNKFDKSLTEQGLKLTRYCDDFIISCRTKIEAENALRIAENQLNVRKLRLHPDKTRIIEPNGEFEFLGFKFAENKIVEIPRSVPSKIAEQIRKAGGQIANVRDVKKMRNWEGLLKFVNQKYKNRK
jgi:RNA-directed DNA polymerase